MAEPRWSFGCLSTLAWLFVALLVTVVAGVAIGVSATTSERLGVTATYVMALPVGLVWSATVAALVVYFSDKGGKRAQVGVPIGCGCLGAGLLPVLVWVFFEGIFPNL